MPVRGALYSTAQHEGGEVAYISVLLGNDKNIVCARVTLSHYPTTSIVHHLLVDRCRLDTERLAAPQRKKCRQLIAQPPTKNKASWVRLDFCIEGNRFVSKKLVKSPTEHRPA